MKIAAALLVVAVIAVIGAAVLYIEPWADDEREPVDLDALSEEFQGSACRQLAGIAAGIATLEPPPSAVQFLRGLGRNVAGIRPPPRAYGDLARGGYNLVPGRGFLARFDDGTPGQARHFAGIAAASTFGGGNPTRFISIFVRGDPEDSPDGRLTDEGILFAQEVLRGELELDQTPEWLLDHLCRRSPA